MAKLFFSYSHKDAEFRDRLEVSLAMLKRQNAIETWHDRRITAGSDFEGAISEELEAADVILLLVSPDFLASPYCYDVEMLRAMERQDAGEARVIPVILRLCDWGETPFRKLMATPPDGKPVTRYADHDEAFLEITQAIKKAVGEMAKPMSGAPALPDPLEVRHAVAVTQGPRSSNLRVAKSFSDADRDRFLTDSFIYLTNYFGGSLSELEARNPEITTTFRTIDANHFTAVIYQNGRQVSRCSIRLGNALGNGITYSSSDTDGSFNEQLRVESDEQSLYLKSLGLAARGSHEEKLSQEGGAELYWAMLIGPLQQRNHWR